jgi:anion-transporting  ArsA/GET3 family ATPase
MAADAGLSVLIVELEHHSGLATALGFDDAPGYGGIVASEGDSTDGVDLRDPLGDLSRLPAGSVHVREITPEDALVEYLSDHGLRRISKRLAASGVLEVVANAIPGIQDILILGKVKQLEQSGVADLIVVDAPATGHVMTFLSSAGGLLDAAKGGPVRVQAAEVTKLLSDPARCQIALVTLPEEMPVNEVIEAAYQLEDQVGVSLGPVIVNACYPLAPDLEVTAQEASATAGVDLDDDLLAALEAARLFHRTRQQLQQEQIDRLADQLPLAQLHTPFLFTAGVGPTELNQLAHALADQVALLPDRAGS